MSDTADAVSLSSSTPQRQLTSINNLLQKSDGEKLPPPQELRLYEGSIPHGELRKPLQNGLDYRYAINRDVSISLDTSAIVAIQEVLMTLITAQYGRQEEPREFDREDFVETYVDLCEVGPSGDEKRILLEDRADELIGEAKSADILLHGKPDRINSASDYRVLYEGSGTEKLRDTVESKLINERVPREKAEIAYQRVKSDFEPENGLKSELGEETDSI